MKRIWILGVVLGLALAACSDPTTSEEYVALEGIATQAQEDLDRAQDELAQALEDLSEAQDDLTAIPPDAKVVAGTATCDRIEDGGIAADGTPGTVFVCELEMSDPTVSGTQRDDRWRTIAARSTGFAWVFEESVITNEGGTWRGAIQAADDSAPCGEAHYVGEDAYEGLEFHYYFCDVGDIPIRGWITGGE